MPARMLERCSRSCNCWSAMPDRERDARRNSFFVSAFQELQSRQSLTSPAKFAMPAEEQP
jgi:hypothetical protein